MQKRVFISYTLRDLFLDKGKLSALKKQLSAIADIVTYIDVLDNYNSFDPQGEVIYQLKKSDIIWVINSPGALSSQWVSKEISIAEQCNKRIYYLSTQIVEKILNLQEYEINKYISPYLC